MNVTDPSASLLSRVDELLDELQASGPPEDWSVWCDHFASALLGNESASWSELFSGDQSKLSRRRTAIALLRLLHVNDGAFEEPNIRVAATTLFDEELPDVYSSCKTDKNAQSYQKLQALRDFVPRAEKDFQEGLSLPVTVAGLEGYRQRAMRSLNSTVVKALLSPFIDRELYRNKFDSVLVSMDAYRHASDINIHESWDDYQRTASQATIDIAGAASRYTLPLLSTINQLTSLLQAHFALSAANQPASITVLASEKKQPLHAPGVIDLRLVVRNAGPGIARDVYLGLNSTSDVLIANPGVFLGTLPRDELVASLAAEIVRPATDRILTGYVNWRNMNGEARCEEFIFELKPQRYDVDWDALTTADLYALEPVESDRELIGRHETVDSLQAMAEAGRVGNAYIFGQKRVGKTSIAKTFRTRMLSHSHGHPHLLPYIEAGEYVRDDPRETIEALGELICEELREADVRFAELEVPEFSGALAPLTKFLRGMSRVDQLTRLTIILDEFDSLPPELFRRSEVGDALFQTIRSIAGKANCGFILIGGENMQLILSSQGDALNKFKQFRVDYFDRSTNWPDYVDLVRRQSEDWLEISDDAVVALYEWTAGNPFFTNLVCGTLANLMIDRRDTHATRTEVEESVQRTVDSTGSPSFAHFWSDGISGTGPEAERVSLVRRKVLLGFAETLRNGALTTAAEVASAGRRFGVLQDDVEHHLEEFRNRGVLLRDEELYRCRVPLFGRWLREKGQREIVTNSADLEAFRTFIAAEDLAYVDETEVLQLAGTWGTFKGQEIGSEAIRAWLSQFGSMQNQRLMFRMLQKIRFYNGAAIRTRLRDAHDIVARALSEGLDRGRYGPGKQRRRDVVLTHLDDLGKSGAQYARWYADENAIYVDNVVPRSRLAKVLLDRAEVEAVVFVDDFIGSGRAASDDLHEFAAMFSEGIPDLRWIFVAISGFASGAQAVESAASKLGIGLEVRLCDPLPDSARCFEGEEVYPDPVERDLARSIAYEHGVKLVSTDPLGYGQGQALVVFDSSIPNNCPPVLWHSSGDWTPLFRRI
jgi:hypothetical protein